MSNKSLGRESELLAARFLEERGYALQVHSYRSPFGEIDLVAQKRDILVFVEVKARSSGAWGLPEQAVDARKQAKMVKTALCYIKHKALRPAAVRFDVIAIENGVVRHIENAFQASSRYTY
ncbi:MAG: YraN family protein [Elusimicrobia bacterium RIFCSPLOWO2_12_FULL_59_9]|nr:MAG: YraN family protein [Elusimicrobia bacterium RIFCSPLOWO2_12_FULL_59_9]